MDVTFLFERFGVAYLSPQAKVGCQVLQRHSLALLDEIHKGPHHALYTQTCSTCHHHLACSALGLHVYVADNAWITHILHHVKALTDMTAAASTKPCSSTCQELICAHSFLSVIACTNMHCRIGSIKRGIPLSSTVCCTRKYISPAPLVDHLLLAPAPPR